MEPAAPNPAGPPGYIDGFVHPVPTDRLDAYRRLVGAVAAIWREHGALDYQEFIGDDMALEGTRPFPDIVGSSDDETIVFGWVLFESREARDLANRKVAADPRVAELIERADSGFDPSRMGYGGFRPLVPAGGEG